MFSTRRYAVWDLIPQLLRDRTRVPPHSTCSGHRTRAQGAHKSTSLGTKTWKRSLKSFSLQRLHFLYFQGPFTSGSRRKAGRGETLGEEREGACRAALRLCSRQPVPGRQCVLILRGQSDTIKPGYCPEKDTREVILQHAYGKGTVT